ncbi:MAG: AMP-binding protein [Candidatus Competibacter sp.]|nr:AMP-binding protein [Candidatus Competibacter sp.]
MSGWYTGFVSGWLFPLHEALKGHDSVARLRALERSQWWSLEELERHRLESLRAFLVHAGARVPYYRRLFEEARFDPGALSSLEDLQRLPFLTKPLIRANTEALKAQDAGPLKRYNTGGSSGEPLIFFMGRDRISHDVAARWRATRWWGVDIGDPEIVVWGSPIELGTQDRLRAIRDAVLRTHLLPAFEMSEANLDRFVAEIRRRRPRMLFGYPSALSLIARHAERHSQCMDDLGIVVAFVTSERLYEDQRETIARIFGCQVANGYGARDAGFIAHQCPSGGMHLSAEDIVVELIDHNGRLVPAGEAGEIVVTHLATRDFPLVRYRTGDIAVMDDRPCPCGRGLPMLKEIQGRATDFVVAADGTIMHGLALIYVVRDLPGIEQFKIIQESRDFIRVLLVPGPGWDSSVVPLIDKTFKARLGPSVRVEVMTVAEIAPEKSGKFRYVMSRVVDCPSKSG